MKKRIRIKEIKNLPSYCDYSCKYAEFSDPTAIGACRKELAVWCTVLKKYNNKNAKCLIKLTMDD
ncbi:MAG: hypothetical protein FJ213_13125 [Ignavibacteria bacterium]|nr:hypothetical protein [Ignavibacteria bacterium]